jgi:hypothetical protein
MIPPMLEFSGATRSVLGSGGVCFLIGIVSTVFGARRIENAYALRVGLLTSVPHDLEQSCEKTLAVRFGQFRLQELLN